MRLGTPSQAGDRSDHATVRGVTLVRVAPRSVALLTPPRQCDFFQRHRGHLSRHIMWRDSSISRATRLGAAKRATSWNLEF
jgi:hypothetical protein